MGSSHQHYSNHYPFSLLLLLVALLLFRSVSASPGWVVVDRKIGLIGPGSVPPTCRTKCGRCWPCEPVHVPIQPGVSLPLEYYPEAWRCRCGNKIFMP